MERIEVKLQDIIFFGKHGLYEEEILSGGEFKVDLAVFYVQDGKIQDIGQTIDYVTLYNIIKDHMQKPTALLETICQDILEEIHNRFLKIDEINICITKLHPPIPNFQGKLGVSIHKTW